ncbi:MAG: hypothetical protein D6719_04245, partial [Candidatus Dadabacteria bacterium]
MNTVTARNPVLPGILGWLLIFSCSVAGVIPFLNQGYMSVDVGETIYHAREIASGRVLYRDIFTHHFGGHILPYLTIELFCDITPELLWCITALVNFINAILFFFWVSTTANRKTGWLAALATSTMGWLWHWEGMMANVQFMLMPFLIFFNLCISRAIIYRSGHYWVAAAACLGYLLISDQRSVFFLPLLCLPFFRRDWGSARNYLIKVLFALFTLPLAACIYLYANDALRDAFNATILFPVYYRNHGALTSYPNTLYQLFIESGIQAEPIFIALALCGFIVFISKEKRKLLVLQIVLGLFGAVLYAATGGRVFPHYLLFLMPPMIFLIASIPYY